MCVVGWLLFFFRSLSFFAEYSDEWSQMKNWTIQKVNGMSHTISLFTAYINHQYSFTCSIKFRKYDYMELFTPFRVSVCNRAHSLTRTPPTRRQDNRVNTTKGQAAKKTANNNGQTIQMNMDYARAKLCTIHTVESEVDSDRNSHCVRVSEWVSRCVCVFEKARGTWQP